MSKTYSAGIVTAYGAAKRAGYQGTYEDFCRQQAGYAESAATVEQAKNTAVSAASTATTKAGEAATAATAAQTAKTQTEQSASQALTDIATARSGAISALQTEGATQTANATAQAQAAAQSATTASTKASEASASATSAGQSATNAAASATSAANAASAAQDVLDSIPTDCSDLSANVSQLQADLEELQEGGYIADAQQIQTKINAWLAEHPEATTTVQDGSLTEAKFTNEVKAKLIPYGIDFVYDDPTAATSNAAKLQGVLDNHQNGVMIQFDSSKKLYLDTINVIGSNVFFVGGVINGTFVLGDGKEYTWSACQNIHFENVVFDNINYTKDAIVANTVYQLFVDNCKFVNCKTSIKTDPTSLAHQILRRGVITNCVLNGLNHALDFRTDSQLYYSVGDLQIANNIFGISSSSDGYPNLEAAEMDVGYSLYGVRCDGIKIEGNTFFTSGIYLYKPMWSHIHNNNIFNTYARGIYLVAPQNMIITGNNIGWIGYVFQTLGQGIYVDTIGATSPVLNISNNNFIICLGAGIKFKNVKNAIVANNYFRDCGGTIKADYAGEGYVKDYEAIIYMDSDCKNNKVIGNNYYCSELPNSKLTFINDESYVDNNDFEDVIFNSFDRLAIHENTRNMLPNQLLQAITTNGVTATPNADGSVTINGTATENTRFTLYSTANDGISSFPLKAGQRYRFWIRGNRESNRVALYLPYKESGNNDWQSAFVWNYGVQYWKIPDNLIVAELDLRIAKGASFDNVVVYPMCSPDYITSYFYTKYNAS